MHLYSTHIECAIYNQYNDVNLQLFEPLKSWQFGQV